MFCVYGVSHLVSSHVQSVGTLMLCMCVDPVIFWNNTQAMKIKLGISFKFGAQKMEIFAASR